MIHNIQNNPQTVACVTFNGIMQTITIINTAMVVTIFHCIKIILS